MKKIYFGGAILTMDKACPRAEALLTENGKILAVGKLSDFETVDAQRIHLEGRTLLPAFVDGHSHALNVGLSKNHFCDLMGCTGFEDMLERIRKFRKEKDKTHGEPIRCRGYDPAIMKEGCHPTAKILDTLDFDNPIACTHQSGHIAVYNTVAMKKAGVSSKTFVCPENGFAGKDENGELNGYFEESAKNAVGALFNTEYSVEDYRQALATAQEHYVKNGFTTLQNGSQNAPEIFALMEKLAQEGALKVDLVSYVSPNSAFEDFRMENRKKYAGGYINRLKLGGVKLFLDGSPQARTAWFTEPYEGESSYRGYPMTTDEKLERNLRSAVRCGLQPIAHCNGDAASEQFLRVMEMLAAEGENIAPLRPVMVHAQTVRYDQLTRMKKIGMMPSFFVGHCYFWGDTHLKNLGDRGRRISPMRRALEEGLVCSIHQDSPVTEPDMLHSVWCAVNRISRDGVIVGEENRIDCYDALIAATRGGAYSYFEENTKGVLMKGAVADLVVLDRDPTAVEPMEIKDIRVLATIKNDEVIYHV